MKMTVAEKLRNLRDDSEPYLTQSQLAQVLNTTQRKISRLETGEAQPSVEDLQKLCLHYMVSADYLLGLPEQLPYPKR